MSQTLRPSPSSNCRWPWIVFENTKSGETRDRESGPGSHSTKSSFRAADKLGPGEKLGLSLRELRRRGSSESLYTLPMPPAPRGRENLVGSEPFAKPDSRRFQAAISAK